MTTEHMTSKNSESANPPGKSLDRRRRWRILLCFCLVVLLLLLILKIGIAFWSRAALERAEQRLSDNGESLDFRDFIPPEIPVLENASHHLEAASRLFITYRHEPFTSISGVDGQPYLLEELSRVLGIILEGEEKPDDRDLAVIRICVERCDNLYRILDEARTLEKARFDTSYSGALAMEYEVPNLLSRLNMARLLSARAILAMHEGRTGAAYQDAATMFRLASWVDQETPVMIGKFIAIAIARLGCHTVNQLMQVAPPGLAEVERIAETVGELDIEGAIDQAFHFERAVTISTLTDPDLNLKYLDISLMDGPLGENALVRFAFHSYARLAAAVYSDGMTRAMRDSAPPAWQREVDPNEEEYLERYCSGMFSFPASMILMDCFQVSNRRDILLAHLDLMALAFRLEDHHREDGAYPDRLDRLAGPQPLDPFSGEDYRYRREDGGYMLYSVAGNRVDDGGRPMPKPWKNREGDLVWRMR